LANSKGRAAFCAAFVGIASVSGSVLAQEGHADAWALRKCDLYAKLVEDAASILGKGGLRPSFLDANAAFVASRCATGFSICPVTQAELDFVNMLTVMTMNEGMASTFVPIACPD
jgi:hypothetical protein